MRKSLLAMILVAASGAALAQSGGGGYWEHNRVGGMPMGSDSVTAVTGSSSETLAPEKPALTDEQRRAADQKAGEAIKANPDNYLQH
ncbi:hypothetical protein QU481_14215 [Crenobacter sp. SG2303]|uniref:DUF4148 domain-containing protein n=1 Tax=Crenobacter oryzisoli TaxID=3056844 RepID=A0ABT7XQH2_9NEIS|nr:hypothetical protein [Crenobacter sp. SG2303]MDN0076042.1 hypothetical protein [Crenobacter sp. SG2303]